MALTVAAMFCISLGTMILVALPSATFSIASMLRKASMFCVGGSFVEHADRVGLGFLHKQQGLGLAFGFADLLLLDSLGAQDRAFLLAFGAG